MVSNSAKLDRRTKKPLQPPVFHVRTALQWSWRYPAAIQSSLSLAGARQHPVNGSGLQNEAIKDRGPALLLLHAILESVHPKPVDGVSNGSLTYKQRTLTRSLSLPE